MKLASFDPLRTLGLPVAIHIKPDHFYRHIAALRGVDWVLFPEYWQVNPLVFGLNARIFPSLSAYLLGHDKIEMTRTFLSIVPEHVPQTVIVANAPEHAADVWDQMTLPFVAKIPRSSMGCGVFLIETPLDWRRYLGLSPVIYAQEYLPIDRDVRIVVAGHQVLGGFWRIQSNRGFYNNISRGGQLDLSPVPETALELVGCLCRMLKINYAGFDVAMVAGHPYLLEFNRLFGNFSLNLFAPKVPKAIMDFLSRESDENNPLTPIRPPTPLPRAA